MDETIRGNIIAIKISQENDRISRIDLHIIQNPRLPMETKNEMKYTQVM
jgi:hypothetical protein